MTFGKSVGACVHARVHVSTWMRVHVRVRESSLPKCVHACVGLSEAVRAYGYVQGVFFYYRHVPTCISACSLCVSACWLATLVEERMNESEMVEKRKKKRSRRRRKRRRSK